MARQQNPGCLSAILGLFGITPGQRAVARDLPYRLRDDFLSAAELSFYRVLRVAVKDQAIPCAKVRLADIFFVARPHENRAHRNKIDRKHVDFLLCEPESMQPLVGIELDDASHRRKDRAKRDQFVDSVFQTAGLPLIHVPVRAMYDPKSLVAQLAPHLGANTASAAPPKVATAADAPVCPKCGVPMVKRMASRGANKGKPFWGCVNYPRCKVIA